MEKNKTAEKYLTQTVTAKWDIIFGALVAVGVILFLVGWGWGYYFSIPAVFVGAAGFFLARSQRVSDDDYQGLLDHILVDNRIEKTAKPGALMLTSYVMKDSRIARGIDRALRSDIYFMAEFGFGGGSCRIVTHTVDIAKATVAESRYTVPVAEKPRIEAETVETRLGPVTQSYLVFDNESIRLPVDTSSADVDEVMAKFGR